MIPDEAVEAARNNNDAAAQEVPEHRRGQDNATTVRAMLMWIKNHPDGATK